MKTMLIPILTVAATCTAFADLERKDSSEFTRKYEMLKLPTAEDVDGSDAYDFTGINANATWCTLGTGSNTGTVYMAISGGQNLTSSENNGTAGDVWKNLGVTAASGYTFETRLKVTESTGTAGAVLLNASYGVKNHNSWLQFYDDKLTWGSNVLTNMDTSAWHTYRLVALENKYKVYVDGVLVNKTDLDNGYGYNSALNRLIFGGGGGSYAGKAQVAYLRFTKGAYAPIDPKNKANWLASSEFDVKYEMNDTDKVPTSTSTSDWTINGASGATIVKNGGVLSVTPNSKQPYWLSTDATWKNVVGADTAFTIEFAVQPKSCTISGADRTMQFVAGIPNATSVLNVGTNHVYWQATDSNDSNILLDSSDNSDKMHKFRIAYDGKSTHGFTVWRDDVKIGEALVGNQTWHSLHYVRFGIPGRNHGGNFDIDYVRWKIGGVYPPDTRKGLMVIVK